MAEFISRSGERRSLGETSGEFSQRLRTKRIAERGLSRGEKAGLSAEQTKAIEEQAREIASRSEAEQKKIFETGKIPVKTQPKTVTQIQQEQQKKAITSYVAYDTARQQSRQANVFEQALAQKREQEQSLMSREVSKQPQQVQTVEQYLMSEPKDKTIIVKQTSTPESITQEVQAEYKSPYNPDSTKKDISKDTLGGQNGYRASIGQDNGNNISPFNPISNRKMDNKENVLQKTREKIDNFFIKRQENLAESKKQLGSLKGEPFLSKNRLEASRLSASYFTTATLGTISSSVLHPIQFGKGIVETVAHPIKSVKTIFTGIKTKPEETVGQLVGSSIVIGGVLKAIPVKGAVRTTEIPQASGEAIKITQVGLETTKGKAVVVGAKTPEGLNFGSPNIKPYLETAKTGELLRIGSALETKTLQKNILQLPSEKFVSPERATEFIPTAKSILSKTKNVKSSYQKGFVLETERLPSKGVSIVLEVAKKEKGVISGSFSRSADLMREYTIKGEKFELAKIPRDIDIHFDTLPSEKIALITKETASKLQKAGFDARLIDEGGVIKNAIEIRQQSGEYAKAVEFLGEGTIPKSEVPPEYVLGIKKAGTPEKLQGIQKTTLAEELRGVTQGTARLQKTPEGLFDILPPEKRLKDISSVSVSARTLESSKLFKGSLLKDIEKFESLYPEELVREQVKRVGEVEKKTIFDFRETSESKIASPSLLPVNKISTIPNKAKEKESSPFEIKQEPNSLVSGSPSASNVFSVSIIPNKPSPSVSPSTPSSLLPSPSVSPSKSPSRIKSPSPSISPSLSISPSISMSPSKSPSASKSPSSTKSVSPSLSMISIKEAMTKIPKPISMLSSSPTKKKEGSFGVSIRRKGQFKELPQTFATEEQAISFGQSVVGQTSSASLKTFKSNKQATSQAIGLPMPQNFIKSKRESGVYIELKEKRMKKGSFGLPERLDISRGMGSPFKKINSQTSKKKGFFF